MICPDAAYPAMSRCRLTFGGGARSDYCLKALANVLDRSLAFYLDPEHAAALGAPLNDDNTPDGG